MNTPLQARVFGGDARDLGALRDGEVQLVVTSPPYWQIKDYGACAQIGFGQSLHDYLFDLARVMSECFRVLQSGRRLCVNIGDQFARTEVYGRYQVIPLHSEVIAMCQSAGFDYLGSIIWQKKTTLNTSGGATIMGSFPHPPNGIVELDYEHILLFKKPGKPVVIAPLVKAQSEISKDDWKLYFAGHWHFGGARQLGHEATFPAELPHRLIRMFSFAGETVLDPFLGSGTTARAALELERSAIGWELNADYLPLIREKICPEQLGLDLGCGRPQIEFADAPPVRPTEPPPDYRPHVADALPLRDAAREKAERESEPLFKVSAVLDERTLRLEDGREIALLGLEIGAHQRQNARDYLEKSVRGKWVYLRHDGDLGEAYLLLKNKLFVNRKMIEANLADAADAPHKWRAKFKKAQETR